MSRFTKKSTKFLSSYEWNRDLPTKTFVQLGMNKLGKVEDILEKFGIDDLDTLEEILKVHKHLLDHDYSTLPKEDFDLLFEKVEALDVIKEKGLHYMEISLIKSSNTYEDYVDEMKIVIGIRPMIDGKMKTKEEYDLLKKVLLWKD